MLNRLASLTMSTSILKALPGKLDIKRHSPSILYVSASLTMSTSILKALPGKLDIKRHSPCLPGRVAQSVTCLATDACLTADPGVASSIPAWSHTLVEIDHEIISTVILFLPLIYSRRVVVSYKRMYVHELLVNHLFKPAQEKVWLDELTVPQ